jgi:hypothetical protein
MDVLAYLDPGSGSMLLQALLGGLAGFAVAVKMFGRRLFSYLKFWKRTGASPPRRPSVASPGVEAAPVKTKQD